MHGWYFSYYGVGFDYIWNYSDGRCSVGPMVTQISYQNFELKSSKDHFNLVYDHKSLSILCGHFYSCYEYGLNNIGIYGDGICGVGIWDTKNSTKNVEFCITQPIHHRL